MVMIVIIFFFFKASESLFSVGCSQKILPIETAKLGEWILSVFTENLLMYRDSLEAVEVFSVTRV